VALASAVKDCQTSSAAYRVGLNFVFASSHLAILFAIILAQKHLPVRKACTFIQHSVKEVLNNQNSGYLSLFDEFCG
jgi:hypothetical protein